MVNQSQGFGPAGLPRVVFNMRFKSSNVALLQGRVRCPKIFKMMAMSKVSRMIGLAHRKLRENLVSRNI
jgi:hypothetical protein